MSPGIPRAFCLIRVLTLLFVVFSALCGSASAQVTLAGNLGPGDSYNPFLFLPTFLGEPVDYAVPFTVGGSGDFIVTGVEAPLIDAGGENAVSWELWSSSGAVPGSLLGTIHSSVGTVPAADPPPVTEFLSVAGLTVTGGNTYFLALNAPPTAAMGWFSNSTGQNGYAFRGTDGIWASDPFTPSPAFRLHGVAANAAAPVAPEPATLALLLMGGLFAVRRRR
jgi:hypothetical protein